MPQSQATAIIPEAEVIVTTQTAGAEPVIDVVAGIGFFGDLLVAGLILFAGYWLAKMLTAFVRRLFNRRKVEVTVVEFVCNLLYGFLLVVVCLMAGDRLGLPTTSLVAIVGASTLAIGIALRDSLANFAAGVLLVSFRYYRIRDRVEVAGASGIVEAVHIFCTILLSDENSRTIVPNGNILKAPIKNLTANPTSRLEITVKVAYNSDVAKVKQLLTDILGTESDTLNYPSPSVDLKSFGGGVLEFRVRAWCTNETLWRAQTSLNERIKSVLDAEQIVVM